MLVCEATSSEGSSSNSALRRILALESRCRGRPLVMASGATVVGTSVVSHSVVISSGWISWPAVNQQTRPRKINWIRMMSVFMATRTKKKVKEIQPKQFPGLGRINTPVTQSAFPLQNHQLQNNKGIDRSLYPHAWNYGLRTRIGRVTFMRPFCFIDQVLSIQLAKGQGLPRADTKSAARQ